MLDLGGQLAHRLNEWRKQQGRWMTRGVQDWDQKSDMLDAPQGLPDYFHFFICGLDNNLTFHGKASDMNVKRIEVLSKAKQS